jgi:hypothetical protein
MPSQHLAPVHRSPTITQPVWLRLLAVCVLLASCTFACATSAFAETTVVAGSKSTLPVPLPEVNGLSKDSPPTLPTSIRAVYKVYRGNLFIGTIEEQFARDGDRYTISSVTRADGALSWLVRDELRYHSEGRIGREGFVPALFSSQRKSDATRNFTSRFNWARGELVREQATSGGIESETFSLPVGTQDRLSAMYQFMLLVPNGNSVSTTMTQGKQSERYVYAKLGEPIVKTPSGEYATRHYAREVKPGESKAELWLARDLYFVPVKAVFTDAKGTALQQTLTELLIQ